VALRNALNGPQAKKYWHSKMSHLSLSLHEVDSKAMERAIWGVTNTQTEMGD